MTLENLLKDVHRAAEQKARIDTCVELYLEGSLPLLIAASKSRLSTAPGHGGHIRKGRGLTASWESPGFAPGLVFYFSYKYVRFNLHII